MAAKRKKSGELWPQTTSKSSSDCIIDNNNHQLDNINDLYIELQQRIVQLEEEKDKNLIKLRQLEQTIQEADDKCATHLKQLTELKSLVGELEIKLEEKNEHYNQAIKQLEDAKLNFSKQEEKWQIFQKDLLTTVRVANDLKTEAEEQSDLLLNENKTLTEKIAVLEMELSKLKVNGQVHFEKNEPNGNTINNQVTDKNKLIRQQSADSVFSTTNTSNNPPTKLIQQRATSQILNNSNKISVKSLVKTFIDIENASKTNVPVATTCQQSQQQQQISKSPSFNSIKLNNNNQLNSNNNESKSTTISTNSIANSTKLNLQQQQNGNMNSNSITKTSISSHRLPNHHHLINNHSKKENCPINLNNNHNTNQSTTEQNNALNNLIKDAGSIRNGLLRWCQKKVENYEGIEISNFSSSWRDGLAFNALLHSLDPTLIPTFHTLDRNNKKKNFMLAFKASQSIGIQCNLNIEDLINEERPDWSKIMAYVTSIYCHFENKSSH